MARVQRLAGLRDAGEITENTCAQEVRIPGGEKAAAGPPTRQLYVPTTPRPQFS